MPALSGIGLPNGSNCAPAAPTHSAPPRTRTSSRRTRHDRRQPSRTALSRQSNPARPQTTARKPGQHRHHQGTRPQNLNLPKRQGRSQTHCNPDPRPRRQTRRSPRRTTQRLHQTRRHMDLPHQRQRLPRHRRPQKTTRHGLQKTASKPPPATATSQSSPTTTTTWNTTSNISPTPAPTHSSSPAPPAKSSWTPHTAPS